MTNTKAVIDCRIGKFVLTNRTAGARYGIPVLHDMETGREYGPGDELPRMVLLGRFPSPITQTAAAVVRRWRDKPGRTQDETDSADAFLAQIG